MVVWLFLIVALVHAPLGTLPTTVAADIANLSFLDRAGKDDIIVVDGSANATLATALLHHTLGNAVDGSALGQGSALGGHYFGTIAPRLHVAAGGAPDAALRATYALAAAWGVHFGTDADVVPSYLRGTLHSKHGPWRAQ